MLADMLWIEGKDMRQLPLLERKRRLATVMPKRPQALLVVQHVEAQGIALLNEVCANDLEGVVGKWSSGSYCCDGQTTSWIKIKNTAYSQVVGRHELFEGRRGKGPKQSHYTLQLA